MVEIFGHIGPYSQERTESILNRMIRARRCGEGLEITEYCAPGIGLAHSGLPSGRGLGQPVWNANRDICLILEGEVFGCTQSKERRINADPPFGPNTDAEFVLRLYEAEGEDFVRRLNGAFIVAIWDQRARKLILVNDRLGQRPLYYYAAGSEFVFDSRVDHLLSHPAVERRIDPVAVAQLLTFEYPLEDRTLFADVHVLPPGSILQLQDGEVRIRTYWEPVFTQLDCIASYDDYIEGFYEHMRQAVQRQLATHTAGEGVRFGLLLSGGLDSRLLLALLVEAGVPLKTFTYGLPESDDVRLATELAQITRTEHVNLPLPPDYLLHHAEQGVSATGGMSSCVHMHVLANRGRFAEEVDVLFKGYMGDALTGGHLHRMLWASYREDVFQRLLFEETCALFHPGEYDQLFQPAVCRQAKEGICETFRNALAISDASLAADRHNLFDLRQRQRRFILHGVELLRQVMIVRTPFCDNDLVDFMLRVPPGLRYERLLVQETLRRYFPELAKVPYSGTGQPLMPCARDLRIRLSRQVRWKLRSLGLGWVPVPERRPYADYDQWMRTTLRQWLEELLLKDSRLGELVRPEAIRRLFHEHLAGVGHSRKLGMLASLELALSLWPM